jgi:hypothetical protein
MTSDQDPKAALAAIKAAREGVAPPTTYPIGYDVLYGASCALLVAAQGLPAPWSMLMLVLALGGLVLMITSWRRRFKWWVSGYSPPRARWVAIVMGVLFIGLMGMSLYGRFQGPGWLFLLSGGIGFFAAILGGRIWMHVWRQELGGDVR